MISIEDKDELENIDKYSKTNSNFYVFNKLMIKNIDENNINNDEINDNKNDNINNNNKIYNVTHKKKSKKKSKSTEKRNINKPTDIIKEKEKEELYTIKENDIEIKYKEEIKKDFEDYFQFLEKEGITKKEDIYDELNDAYNWKIIDNLIMKNNVKLEEIIKIFIEICKNKNINNNDIFKANEYIKTIIEYYIANLSKNQIDIFHLNMIEIYMGIDDIVNDDSLYMYEIMGNLLFVLLKNKLYIMKDLNNFIEKRKETQINIAKVVKYTIIAAGNSSKKYHNDLKFTKLFNNNDIFIVYVTNELKKNKINNYFYKYFKSYNINI